MKSLGDFRFVTAMAFGVLLIALLATPTRAQLSWTVVMSGLDNPRGLTFARADHDDDDDVVLVA